MKREALATMIRDNPEARDQFEKNLRDRVKKTLTAETVALLQSLAINDPERLRRLLNHLADDIIQEFTT